MKLINCGRARKTTLPTGRINHPNRGFLFLVFLSMEWYCAAFLCFVCHTGLSSHLQKTGNRRQMMSFSAHDVPSVIRSKWKRMGRHVLCTEIRVRERGKKEIEASLD